MLFFRSRFLKILSVDVKTFLFFVLPLSTDPRSRDFDLLLKLSVVSFIFDVKLRRDFVQGVGDGDSGLSAVTSARA